jgi:hypothetical protein
MLKIKNAIFLLALCCMLFFAPGAYALTPVEDCLQHIPASSIFFVASRDSAAAYDNYLKYGFSEAFPDIKTLIDNYERKSQIPLMEEFGETNCYLLALSEINPVMLNFEFITALSVKDINKYKKIIDRGVEAYQAKRFKITTIAGHDVFSVSSPDIKTPLFYLITSNIILSSNKLEGLSKALDLKKDNAKNFLKSIQYQQIKRKYDIDSNLYVWISGRVIAEYLKLFGAANSSLIMNKGEAMMKLFTNFTDGLEFIGMKKSLNETGAESDVFISLNETVAKVIKAKINFAKGFKKLNYEGIELNSLKLIPEACDAFAAAHIVLPPFEDIMASGNSKIARFDIKQLNDRLVKKFKAGIDTLVYPWIADEYFAAQFSNAEGFMAGVKIGDIKAFEKSLKKVENKLYSTNYRLIESYKYKGITVKTASKRVKKNESKIANTYFIIGDYAVMTSNQQMAKIIIDTFNDQLPSIRANRGFVGSCDYAAGDKYKILSWFKTEVMLSEIAPYLSGLIDTHSMDLSKIKLKNTGITNFITSGGQHFKIKSTY